MRSSAAAFGLLAHSILTFDDQGLRWVQVEMEAEVVRNSIKRLIFAVPLRGPIPVPDALPVEARASYARSGSVQALFIPEMFSVRVRQSGMRQIEIPDSPR